MGLIRSRNAGASFEIGLSFQFLEPSSQIGLEFPLPSFAGSLLFRLDLDCHRALNRLRGEERCLFVAIG